MRVARQRLVFRLDSYCKRSHSLFTDVIRRARACLPGWGRGVAGTVRPALCAHALAVQPLPPATHAPHRLTPASRIPSSTPPACRLISTEVLPVLKQCSLAGHAEWKSQHPLLVSSPQTVDILVDVLSDRGFR